jgi:hypothetical protein
MWTHRIEKRDLPIELLRGAESDRDAIYAWTADYDPEFLGYMSGALLILDTLKEGIFVV